jgi:hypothetical protein
MQESANDAPARLGESLRPIGVRVLNRYITAMRKSEFGPCHLCGIVGKLSFEHVPPESAFNDRQILRTEFEKLLEAENLDNLPYRVQRRGAGAFTLCEKCNSDTGGWYVPAYSDWAAQAMSILMAASGRPTLTILYRLFPLRVLKQIVCMFFSVNGPTFQAAQRELVRFVLNRESREFPKNIRIYCFYTYTNRSRSSRVTGMVQGLGTSKSRTMTFSEMTFPPFGFVMTVAGSPPPRDDLFDITWFSEFAYRDWRDIVQLRLPVKSIYTGFPGDYRTRAQTLADVSENSRLEAIASRSGTV